MMSDADILEWVKIVLALTIGFILVHFLLFPSIYPVNKCVCDCANAIRLG
jgi:hypothetical protein